MAPETPAPDQPQGLPNTIVMPNGEAWVLCVGLVATKFPDGTFRMITRIAEDGVVSLAGGEEFVLFYARRDMVRAEVAEGPAGHDNPPE